jgi:hypothetical protein
MAFDLGSIPERACKSRAILISSFQLTNRAHHGIVLDVSKEGFDKAAASFGSIFVDPENPAMLYLFYSGAQDVSWSQAAIGLATSSDGLEFKKTEKNPVFQGPRESFCNQNVVAPVVTQIKNRLYMIFSGSSESNRSRRIGIAHADDPRGPWHYIGELIKPTHMWEGNDIDNGPSLVKLDDETILVYFSSVTSPKSFDILNLWRGYPVRKIGILKVRIRGASSSSIEALRFKGNPLNHLNGSKGSWNESLFCPGYVQINDLHCLFPTGSTYSVGFPYRQHIGMVTGNSPYFDKKTSKIEKLIDGPEEKPKIFPSQKGEIALDTPAPFMNWQERKLSLYYSIADRTDEMWKIALTTFNIDGRPEDGC